MKRTLSIPPLGVSRASPRGPGRSALGAPLGSRLFATLPAVVCGTLALSPLVNGVAQTVVTEPTESALRSAMGNGGWIVFACEGIIALSGTLNVTANTVLNATGHFVAISGGKYWRVFSVSPQAALTLSNLTVQDGAAGPMGGTAGSGGGVLNNGVLNVVGCLFAGNTASGLMGDSFAGGPGSDADGGAICNHGQLRVTACTFLSNSVTGGPGGMGTQGVVAGLNDPPPPTSALNGGPGGPGGAGNGGAIYNAGTAAIVNSTFAANSAFGGWGGPGGDAGKYFVLQPWGDWDTIYGHPGPGGAGGPAVAAICDVNGHCALTNCTLVANLATGRSGGFGAPSGADRFGSWLRPQPQPRQHPLGC